MSLSELVANALFRMVSAAGRPFGGIRPHRLAHSLSKIAYGTRVPAPSDFRWYTDRHGLFMKLHPYYLIDREIIAFGVYERPLQRFIQNNVRPGMICMDVGANMGAMSLHLALRVGETGKVYSFEPVPANAERIREHLTRNGFELRMEVIQSALSDTDGQLELHIAAAAHVNQGMGSLVEIDHGELTNTIMVQTHRLDTFCEERGLNRIDFIKVDIQGAEPLFIKGARQTLQRFKPTLIMEVAPSSLGATGTSSSDLITLMESLGYAAYLIKNSGRRGSRLYGKTTAPNFTAENVLFTPV